jgi:hypothetical protein
MAPAPSKARRLADTGLILLFVTGIGLPLLLSLAGMPTPRGRPLDKQVPAPELRPSWDSLAAFPAGYEEYVGKNLPFRRSLIRWHSRLKLAWLGTSSSAQVVVGTGGWLFYTQRPIAERNPGPFSPAELACWQRVLEERHHWLAARGSRYLFVLAPDKQTIYPEYLPASLRPRSAVSRQDQLLEHLRSYTPVATLDLRSALRQARLHEELYDRTDSHWNERGAFVAYREIMQVLCGWFPVLRPPLARDAFESVEIELPGGDLARMLQLERWLRERHLALAPRAPCQARRTGEKVPMRAAYQLPHLEPVATACAAAPPVRALVLQDSFGTALVSLLPEHFSRTVFVPSYLLDPEIVERERPQVVIQLMVERQLANWRPANDPGIGEANDAR